LVPLVQFDVVDEDWYAAVWVAVVAVDSYVDEDLGDVADSFE